MTLALSPHDQSLVAAATRALVSPLVAPSFEHWLAEVNRTLKELLWADMASFMFPLAGGEIRTVSDEYASSVLQCFMREKQPEIERRWGIRRLSLEQGTFTRRSVYGDRVAELYRSEYWNEYLLPNRAHDVLGMTTALDTPNRVVNLYFHHERPTGRRFGARGLSLGRMLFPAFKAGVHAAHTLFQRRQRLAHLADVMSTGVALADGTGRIVHRNPALAALVQSDPYRAILEAHLAAAAHECVLALTGNLRGAAGGQRGLPDARRLRSTAVTPASRYTVTASALDHEPSTYGLAVAIIVERADHASFPESALRVRYHLTPREIEVTRLLDRGSSNEEIARTLAISPATGRHHTESVLLKLGLRSRARVPHLLATLGGQ
jgi:DNA-binding CsgD family transcriptional regulator/PAS domain-containing protein